jgi:hypothetical protein
VALPPEPPVVRIEGEGLSLISLFRITSPAFPRINPDAGIQGCNPRRSAGKSGGSVFSSGIRGAARQKCGDFYKVLKFFPVQQAVQYNKKKLSVRILFTIHSTDGQDGSC